jgi:hypothetical protein
MSIHLSDGIALWIKGLAAAAISGAANGVITGFAAVGIDPQRFNLQSGIRPTLALAGVSALMSAMIGTSAYLKQSPLPAQDLPSDFDGDARTAARRDRGARDDNRVDNRNHSDARDTHDENHPDNRPR